MYTYTNLVKVNLKLSQTNDYTLLQIKEKNNELYAHMETHTLLYIYIYIYIYILIPLPKKEISTK